MTSSESTLGSVSMSCTLFSNDSGGVEGGIWSRGLLPPPCGGGAGAGGAPEAIMSTVFLTIASGGRNARAGATVASATVASSSPWLSHASLAMIAGPPALVRMPTRAPRGSGWFASSMATSNSSSIVSVRITPDWWQSASTALSAPAREPGGLGAGGGARPRARAAALDRRDRLLACHAAGDLREPARVSERLEVEKDHARAGVLLPVLEEVVGRDVGLVADAHEVRDPEPQRAGGFEDREPERTALRRKRDLPGRRPGRRERRVEPHAGLGVEHPEAVGAHHAHAVLARGVAERPLALGALGAGLLESGGDHDHAEHALPAAFLDGFQGLPGGHHDDRQVDVRRDVGDARGGEHRLPDPAGGIDRVDRSFEPVLEQVPEDRRADRARPARGPDHGDRAGAEDGVEAGRRRGLELGAGGGEAGGRGGCHGRNSCDRREAPRDRSYKGLRGASCGHRVPQRGRRVTRGGWATSARLL